MQGKLESLIMSHIDSMDKMLLITTQILKAAEKGNVNAVSDLTINRQRLLNIISDHQLKIEAIVKSLTAEDAFELKDIINSWNKDVRLRTTQIIEIDTEISSFLEKAKESTTKEIASVYKAKQSFKGYNLNDLKK